ncbi:class I adenylate-forming enzyme family protein [Undibacterium sp. SXout20W]|uniref:class I adenylate-forming enzyme family protein n=1 Tax=Undibacterium sp. SXout20W TaxID=3413051 RepID=UPI003BF21735
MINFDDVLSQSFGTVSDLIRSHAQLRPQQPAITLNERMLDFVALDTLVDRIAASLQREGLQPGDNLAICAASSIEYAAVFLGGLRAGIAVAPLAPSSTPDSLIAMITDADATFIFVDSAISQALAPRVEAIGARLITLDDSDPGTHFNDWLAPIGTRPNHVDIDPDSPFNIIYSSGTTGTPKGIVQSHRMRWMHVQRGAASGYGYQAVVLLATPLYSNTTLVSFMPALALGSSVVLMQKFDAGEYLRLAYQHRVTHTMLVPVQYQRLMAHADFDQYDFSSFERKFCTSAPFSAALKSEILRRWPGALVEYYGMTEGGGTCILAAHEHPDKLHTVGCPAPGHDIRLIDDQGREVQPGGTGEIVGHSIAMMNAYHKLPTATENAEWRDASGRRFIRTGDIGRFDKDGFLILLDRKKDMIISGGFNIYPSDLETVLQRHPDVVEAAVIGLPSQRWGESPVAIVVLISGSHLTEVVLLEWANAQLGKTQRLAAVNIVDTLPRSPIGKVLKRELRDVFKTRTVLL